MTLLADHDVCNRARSAGAFAATLALALAACGAGSDTGPGGVSEGEARALDEAAEKLDQQPLPKGAIPPIDLPVAEQGPGTAHPPPLDGEDSSEVTGDSAD